MKILGTSFGARNHEITLVPLLDPVDPIALYVRCDLVVSRSKRGRIFIIRPVLLIV